MAEVVVDAKPMPKLPYDPEVIPEAVRKRAAAVDALYGTTALTPANGSDGQAEPSVKPEHAQPVQEPAPAPQVPISAGEQPPATPAPSAPAEPSPAPSPPEDENSDTWKARANGYSGRYNAAQKQLAEMQEQMAQLGSELLHAQRLLSARQTQQPSRPPTPPPAYLTEQDVQNYGGDLIDFTQRAAVQAVAPHLQRLEDENAELKQRLAREAKRVLDQIVSAAVPNYLEVDRDPRWHHWLLGIDLYSGRVRQELLNDAIATGNASRVISFFRGFLAEEVATGHIEPAQSSPAASAPREPAVQLATLAAPGRDRPAGGGVTSLPPDKPIYTRTQLRELYSAFRKGAYVGREAEWKRIDSDIIAAGREGRVING
jgi:hypothetical protein